MPIEPITGLPYPAGTDAPDGAGQIEALVAALNGSLGRATPVLRAVDESDRDARYGGTLTPAGVLVASTSGEVWLKVATTGTTQWKLISQDDTLISSGITASAGWAINSQNLAAVGKSAQFYLKVTRTGGVIASSTDGNIGNVEVATFPSAWFPRIPTSVSAVDTGYTVGASVWTNGSLSLNSLPPGVSVNTNDQLSFGGSFLLP